MVDSILHPGDGLAVGQCAENQNPIFEQKLAAFGLVGWFAVARLQGVSQL